MKALFLSIEKIKGLQNSMGWLSNNNGSRNKFSFYKNNNS